MDCIKDAHANINPIINKEDLRNNINIQLTQLKEKANKGMKTLRSMVYN